MEVQDSKEHSSFIYSYTEGWLICNVKSGGGIREGTRWFQGTWNGTKCISDSKIVDGLTSYVHVSTDKRRIRIDIMIILIEVKIVIIIVRNGGLVALSFEIGGEVEMKTLVWVIEVMGDLVVVILVVTQSSRNLDFLNMDMFSSVSRPLHDRTWVPNAGNYALKQFQLWDLPRVISATSLDDCIFVVME